jgi:hypothetical protein
MREKINKEQITLNRYLLDTAPFCQKSNLYYGSIDTAPN